MYCECGCGQLTNIITKTNKRKNLVRGNYYSYIQGHGIKKPSPRYKGIDRLVVENQNKYLCACGCGNYIKIMPHHFYGNGKRGIPKYIHGHHANTPEMKRLYREINAKRIGELSPRWKKNRDEVRGRIRCKVDFTRRQKRDIYLRDKGICQVCEIICLLGVDNNHSEKVNIDHIIPVENGGFNDIFNGQVLCLSCHKLKHSAKAKRMNSRNTRTVNLEPSRVQSRKVQRLLGEDTSSLITRLASSPKGMK